MATACGTVLENLSTKKLCVLVLGLCAVVVLSFAIGFASPRPANVLLTFFKACNVTDVGTEQSLYYRQMISKSKKGNCDEMQDLTPRKVDYGESLDVVFVAEIPRSNVEVMSPFHQFIITLVDFQIQYKVDDLIKTDKIWMDVALAARNEGDNEWKVLHRSTIKRSLLCEYPMAAKENEDLPDGYNYDCIPQSLFQLGSASYQHYLINIRIAKQGTKNKIGQLRGISMPVIYQNRKYTKILFTMKTVFTPFVICALLWFWKRVNQTQRRLELMEKAILFVAVMLLQLDFPIDWFTVLTNAPVVLFLSDIRQGIFYAALLSFWLVFTGEHLVQKTERNNLKKYWRELSAILVCCVSLLLFDSLERGVQIVDPFYTVWSGSDVAYQVAMGLVLMGAVSGTVYLCFLFYLVFKVFQSIKHKQSEYSNYMTGPDGGVSVSSTRKQHILEGVVFRFKFFMALTLALAALSILFFLLVQAQESVWLYYLSTQDYSVDAVFSTGLFGMWNVYIVALLFLYAPSHRNKEDGLFATAANVFQLAQYDEENESDLEDPEDYDKFHGGSHSKKRQTRSSRQGQPQTSSRMSSSNIDEDDDVTLGEGERGLERNLVASVATPQQPSIVYTMLGKQNLR